MGRLIHQLIQSLRSFLTPREGLSPFPFSLSLLLPLASHLRFLSLSFGSRDAAQGKEFRIQLPKSLHPRLQRLKICIDLDLHTFALLVVCRLPSSLPLLPRSPSLHMHALPALPYPVLILPLSLPSAPLGSTNFFFPPSLPFLSLFFSLSPRRRLLLMATPQGFPRNLLPEFNGR